MDILKLILGLALFLYGMDVMGESLKKSAGSSLKATLGKMTSNPFNGFLLGLIVTCVIQSSSATTVMVVGFVNSGTMTLMQAVGVIMGANVGTAVTAWLTALAGIGDGEELVGALGVFKPDSWMPILALIGICLIMFVKRGRKKDIGAVLLGFAVLMTGMELMSDAVSGLKDNEGFKNILLMFGENPLLGLLAGLVLTAVVQSSSASVGILQSLTKTGAITYGAAIPIVMGQNIGTCVTAMLSSIGANKNGRRAALVHLYFNIIAVVLWLSVFYLASYIFPAVFTPLTELTTNMWDIAIIHTVFKILAVIALFPLNSLIVKLSCLTIKDKKDEAEEHVNLLDERLMATPAIAVARATEVTAAMAEISCKALYDSLTLFDSYDPKVAENIRLLEDKADMYEDALGSYLVKISTSELDAKDSKQVTKLLHIIGDFERISDHSVNIVESAEEMREKKIEFSSEAKQEMSVLRKAVRDILELTERAYKENNVDLAAEIEPLEQVVDDLKDKIKANHIIRLQESKCTIEHGFILADLLNNFERVSDHCSNIGGCVIEISSYDALDMHKYLAAVKAGSEAFEEKYEEYSKLYNIDAKA